MFTKVLIANRGEIACRIIRTLKKMGITSVAIYSEADSGARHVLDADVAICVGAAPAAESYLNVAKILQVATETGAQAIHPGYGFLSENASFAEACEEANIAFIGPTPNQMRDFGLKHTARHLAQQNGVPLLPGTGLLKKIISSNKFCAEDPGRVAGIKFRSLRRHYPEQVIGYDLSLFIRSTPEIQSC